MARSGRYRLLNCYCKRACCVGPVGSGRGFGSGPTDIRESRSPANLGKYNSSIDNVVQEESGINWLLSTPTFWNNTVYFVANGDYPRAFSSSNRRLSVYPTSQTSVGYRHAQAVPVVSANLNTNGIMWAMQRGGTG